MSERVRDFVGAPVFGQCDTEKHLLPSPVTETGKTEARERTGHQAQIKWLRIKSNGQAFAELVDTGVPRLPSRAGWAKAFPVQPTDLEGAPVSLVS